MMWLRKSVYVLWITALLSVPFSAQVFQISSSGVRECLFEHFSLRMHSLQQVSYVCIIQAFTLQITKKNPAHTKNKNQALMTQKVFSSFSAERESITHTLWREKPWIKIKSATQCFCFQTSQSIFLQSLLDWGLQIFFFFKLFAFNLENPSQSVGRPWSCSDRHRIGTESQTGWGWTGLQQVMI